MPAFKYDLTFEQGAIFKKTFVWSLPGGGVQDLTGWTARMQVRRRVSDDDVLVELTTENDRIILGDALGTVYLEIPADVTVDLPEVNNGRFDLELISGDEVTRLVEGKVTITANVTR